MSDTYRKSCPNDGCGFVTNEYGTEQAAKDALARHQQHCSKGK